MLGLLKILLIVYLINKGTAQLTNRIQSAPITCQSYCRAFFSDSTTFTSEVLMAQDLLIKFNSSSTTYKDVLKSFMNYSYSFKQKNMGNIIAFREIAKVTNTLKAQFSPEALQYYRTSKYSTGICGSCDTTKNILSTGIIPSVGMFDEYLTPESLNRTLEDILDNIPQAELLIKHFPIFPNNGRRLQELNPDYQIVCQ